MSKHNHPIFKYYTPLAMSYGAILIISVLLDYKFINLFGDHIASSATFIVSITFFLSDVITEVYGYKRGKQVVWSGAALLVLISVLSFFLKNLPTPSSYAAYGHAYDIILELLSRSSISNAIAIMIGSIFNVYFISKWKVLVKGRYFWLRSLGSSAIGESLYTLMVVSLVNVGMVTASQFFDILVVSYLYKLIFDSCAVIPASLLASFLKKAEGVDIYDFPLKFTSSARLKSVEK